MHRLVLLVVVLGLMLVSGCRPVTAESAACRASLNALNRTGVEQIIFGGDFSGHEGYSLVTPNCDFFIPLSTTTMSEAERARLHMEVRRVIRQASEDLGIGFFKASCDCSYDPRSGTANATSITDLTLHPSPGWWGMPVTANQ